MVKGAAACRTLLLGSSILLAAAGGSTAQQTDTAGPEGQHEGAAPVPDLVILTETGQEREGLPVLTLHPEPGPALETLTRGLSGTFLRVYRMEQAYLHAREGTDIEPAYVLLSSNQGGFGRVGFFLDDTDKSSAGYVDIHRDGTLSGRFGAMDQIVPHELAHVMLRQLAGPVSHGYANQIHALGLRTDRVTAFNEGFAEHLQAVAFEASPDVPVMVELAADVSLYEKSLSHLQAYRRELEARLGFAPRMRMGFLLWYSKDEDVQRYFAVRDNAFAREPELPERLLRSRDPYDAYLLEAVLPGAPDGQPKSPSRMLASEGVVSALFYRWALDRRLGSHRRPAPFYEPFGVTPEEISDLENVYLKLIEVFYLAKPRSVLDVIEAYGERFPDEAPWVDDIVEEIFLGQPLDDVPRLWLANRAFETGTTLFDQYRGLPRVHTFDLNAASLVDLVGVPGVDLDAARAIRAGRPYARVQDVGAAPGLDPAVADRFVAMEAELDVLMEELEAEAASADTLSINRLLMPFVWRLVFVLVLSAAAGAALYRWSVRQGSGPGRSWVRSGVNGATAALVGMVASWALGWFGLGALAAVGVLLALPAAAIQRLRHGAGGGGAVFAGWMLAVLPVVLLTNAWF